MTSSSPIVVVCGSTNIDTFVHVNAFPAPGETTIGQRGVQGLGGKGANQAAASAKMGVRTVLFSAVGDPEPTSSSDQLDPLATLALKELSAHGVDTSFVRHTDQPTGQAFIMNDDSGENIIIVTSGANETVSPADFHEDLRQLAQTNITSDGPSGEGAAGNTQPGPIILAQGELTAEHSAELPALARQTNSRLILNLAPVTTTDPELLAAADPLIVNQLEAADVTGKPRETPLLELYDALRQIATSAVVTLGAEGAAVITQDSTETVPSPVVDHVVDTTGAGDAFAGTLAASIARGLPMSDATRLATAAGSLATQKPGAAASYAPGAEVEALAAEAAHAALNNTPDNTPES